MGIDAGGDPRADELAEREGAAGAASGGDSRGERDSEGWDGFEVTRPCAPERGACAAGESASPAAGIADGQEGAGAGSEGADRCAADQQRCRRLSARVYGSWISGPRGG